MKKTIKEFIISFLTTFSFLLRLQLPFMNSNYFKKNYSQKDYPYTYKYFGFFMPFVGILIAFILFFIYFLCFLLQFVLIFITNNLLNISLSGNFFEPFLLTIVILVFQYFISNLFHFDGLVDTLDAVIVYKNKQERFKILKDVHIGSFALFGAVIYLVLKIYLIYRLMLPLSNTILNLNFEIIKNGKYFLLITRTFVSLFFYPVSGRLSGAFVSAILLPAKESGLSATIGRLSLKQVILSLIIILIFFFLIIKNFYIIILILISILVSVYSGYYVYKKNFNGITGDGIGFTIELGEIVYLLFFYLLY